MRRAARVDANQAEIVECLRLVGVSVQPLHTVGDGVPDLLLGIGMRTYLAELKRDAAARYTPDQLKWREAWRGSPPLRFDSASDALAWAAEIAAQAR